MCDGETKESKHSEMSGGPKILCLGLDGATMDLILPWIEAGKLPTFKYLRDSGGFGELESVVQPCSAQAWTSFMTGKNPGGHGIFGFRKQLPGSYKHAFASGGMVGSRKIWNILSQSGKQVFIMNVPVTYPPEPVNGCLISGMDAPGTDCVFTYPPEMRKELMRITNGGYVITVHLGGYLTSDRRRRKALDKLLNMAERRTQAALHFLKTHPWHFAMVKYDIPDQAQHYFWQYLRLDGNGKFGDAIYRTYLKLDEIVGRFLREIDEDTTLMVVSDHGGGPHCGKAIYVNEWLRRQGFLAPRFAGKNGRGGIGGSRVMKFSYQFTKWVYHSVLLRILPDAGKDALSRIFPGLRSRVRQYLKFSFLDWRHTRAYLGGNLDVIHVNLKGREPEGIVEPGQEYERLREDIISGLQSIIDPETGRAVFERIYKREEVYEGEYLGEAPDLLLVPRGYAYSMGRDLLDDNGASLVASIRHHRGISGIHTMKGILFLHGRPFKRNCQLYRAKIIDLAPTILYLMGLPVPDDMDGRPLTDAFCEAFVRERPVRYSKGGGIGQRQYESVYTPGEAHAIEARLRGLGYIDS
jgi:predicted AlkP superfamily phosphohydrolase/phosphomutase